MHGHRPALRLAALALLIVALYVPSLGGGFLNWDDGWLISKNPVFATCDIGHAVPAIWTDFSNDTRLKLGAEYLPLRDMSTLFERCVHHLDPRWMRWTNLGLYVLAVVIFARWLEVVLGDARRALLAAVVFAVHPAHVESVAWLSSRKDVLALVFLGGALLAHAKGIPRRAWVVPGLLLCAHLSKSFTVIALALLLAQDLMLRRKPDFTVLAGCTAVALGAAVLHIWVSRRVGMMASFPGGTRSTALITMGPVWLRYMGLLIWPGGLSAFHDAAVLTRWNLAAAAGYTALAGWLWLGTHWWRKRKDPLVLAAWAWFAIPLLPVSHFLFPLQNLMADRYLLLSVMGLALLVAPLARHRVGMLAVITFVTVLALATAHRNALFADSVLLFRDATAKTKTSADAPYQLGQALETAGESRRAQAAYEEALKRAEMRSEVGRRATNSLASLYARSGALGQALSVLERGRKQWPDDPDMLTNLAVVHGALGQTDQARALYRELVARFPDYVAKREAELRSEAARGAPQ